MTAKRDEILDHEADGIREFDNELPRWWLYTFYFTIALGVVYLINFHVLSEPLVGPASIQAEYAADVAAAEAARPTPVAAPASAPGAPVASAVRLTDEESLHEGREIYESATHPCAACHRPDLGGLVGPNLTDNQWLHGCSMENVVTAITTGFPLQGMLPYGGGPALDREDVIQLASYVLSKQGSNPAAPKATDPTRDKVCPE